MTLRVLVQVWCEVDPTLNVRIDRQTGVAVADDGDRLTRVSPLGLCGITEALAIGDADVMAFALGDGHEEALRHALAAGAAQAVQVPVTGDDSSVVALAAWLGAEQPDLVIADRLAGRLAVRLGWAHLAGIDQLQLAAGSLRAIRHLGRGDCERVRGRLPAVVRLHPEPPRLRYISRARLAETIDRPIAVATVPAGGPSLGGAEVGPLQMVRPRTRLGPATVAAPARAVDRLNALMGLARAPIPTTTAPAPAAAAPATAITPDQMAEEFVRYLAHHNLMNDP